MAKKVCPRLRDSASSRGGELTQPKTHFLDISVQLRLDQFSGFGMWVHSHK